MTQKNNGENSFFLAKIKKPIIDRGRYTREENWYFVNEINVPGALPGETKEEKKGARRGKIEIL